jgi:hypothetical protein
MFSVRLGKHHEALMNERRRLAGETADCRSMRCQTFYRTV